jgi:hypothetical protein
MRLPQVPSPGKIAVVAIAGVTPMIVERISKRLPAIIKAWSEARDLHHRRKIQNKLLQAVAEGKEDAKEEGRILSHVCLTPVTGAVGGRLGALAAAPGVLVGHCNV